MNFRASSHERFNFMPKQQSIDWSRGGESEKKKKIHSNYMIFNFHTEQKIWAEKPEKKSAPNDISDGGGEFDECECGWIGSWVVALSVMGFANHAQFHFANHAPVSFKKSLTLARPIDCANNRGRLAFSTLYLLRLGCLFWVLAGRLGFLPRFFFA